MKSVAPIVAIAGRANVGKSSLFNSLIGRREAITAVEAGTTRDSLTAKASYDGKDFWLVDTAGLKSPEDKFELSIQEQIVEAAASADVILVVIEADRPITEADRRVATMALKTRKPVVLAANKADRLRRVDSSLWQKLGIKDIVATSTTQKTGLDELLDKLTDKLPASRIKSDGNVLRLAILGRPNVGKSSLFNTLAKKQQALVSAAPGTTRDINRATVSFRQRTIELMDTAGIRRSGKIEPGLEKFSVLRSLAAIEKADVCLVLMDVNELNVQLDQKIAGLVKEAGKGLILVVTKWDSAKKNAFTYDHLTPQIAANFSFVPWAPLIFTSSLTGQNVTKIYSLALAADSTRRQRLKTAELNRWLQSAIREHPPAGLKNRQPKLSYIVQEDNEFPNFKVFGSDTRFLHWSYKRYLERSLRERWPLEATPLKFWFIDKKVELKHGTASEKTTAQR